MRGAPGVKREVAVEDAHTTAPATMPSVESINGPDAGPGVRFASR